jgi:hypothetical protein
MVDLLAMRIPMLIALVADDLARKETMEGALFVVSTLLTFGGVRPVPSPTEKVTLMLALREPAPGANQEKLVCFLDDLAEGREYLQLAGCLNATNHEPLIAAFRRIAPPRTLERLRD